MERAEREGKEDEIVERKKEKWMRDKGKRGHGVRREFKEGVVEGRGTREKSKSYTTSVRYFSTIGWYFFTSLIGFFSISDKEKLLLYHPFLAY